MLHYYKIIHKISILSKSLLSFFKRNIECLDLSLHVNNYIDYHVNNFEGVFKLR